VNTHYNSDDPLIGQKLYISDRNYVYIYVLVDPNTEQVMYVGQAVCPKARLEFHFVDAARTRKKYPDSERYKWFSDLAEKGTPPYALIVDKVLKRDALKTEAEWIKYYRDEGAVLYNREHLSGPRGRRASSQSENAVDDRTWQEVMADLRRLGLTNQAIADKLGITVRTVEAWQMSQPRSKPKPFLRYALMHVEDEVKRELQENE
jgi:DNA-binding transcriptional regulator YiaG